MACGTIFQAFKDNAESLGKDVHRKATNRSVWLNALPKGTYPLGTGLTQTTFKIENSLPTDDELGWEAIQNTGTTSAGTLNNMLTAGGLCDRSWNDVEWGMSEDTFSPERISIRGPEVCQENLKYQFNVARFLEAYVNEISKHSKAILENKVRNEYMTKSRQVTITGAAGSEALVDSAVTGKAIHDSAGGVNELADTAELLPGHLDQLAIKLIESGATEGDSNGFVELGSNGPVFPLIIGMEASNKLIKADTNVRTDYRESSKSNELLAAIGADRVTGNFRHVVVTNPPRYKRNGSADGYHRISERAVQSPAPTEGVGTQINELYIGKDISDGDGVYEAAIALVPSVMRQLVVPATTPGNLGFSPLNYTGDWQFVTGAYKFATDCTDELETKGRHFGSYEMAFEPVFGEHGATLLFKRDGVVA